uniref:Phosphatidylinositol 4-kinase beta n=1 Tax=Bursaphelenchus xylophilus TaxID=6326 RepID=A0A1I7SLJ6_BURXY
MFGRVPSTDCNHSSTGICPKCNLERTYNLNSTSKAFPIKNDRFIVTNHSQSPKTTPILDVFDLHSNSGSFSGHNTYLPDFKEEDKADTSSRSFSTSSNSEVGSKSISVQKSRTLSTASSSESDQIFMPSEVLDGTIEEQVEVASRVTSKGQQKYEKSVESTVGVRGSDQAINGTRRSSTSSKIPENSLEIHENGNKKILNGTKEPAESSDDGFEAKEEIGIEFSPKIERQTSANGSESGIGTLESGTANVEDEEEDETYTSFDALQKQLDLDGEVEEKDQECSKNLPQGLIRLFESSYFNMEIALQYLYKNESIDVIMYLGKVLHRFPNSEVDFFIPQLISMYINMNPVASAIHNYVIERCKTSMEFSLECFWLLDAYGVDQYKTHHKKAQGFFLKETIINEYMKSHRIHLMKSPAASAALHHRSQSDARLSEDSPPPMIEEPQPRQMNGVDNGYHMRRTESTRSVRSMYQGSAMADLSSGRAFDSRCRCLQASNSSIPDVACSCGADQKTRPEMAFVDSLIAIGNRLKDIPTKEDKSKRLVYELFLLNLNLPARVWLPLYGTNHFIVRIPYGEGCVLNSKDKAPYCIYCEVIEISNIEDVELPQKKVELEGEFHRTMRTNSASSMYNIGSPNNAHLASSFALPTLSPVEEGAAARMEKPIDALDPRSPVVQMVAPTITEPEQQDDDVLTQFDKIIDESLSVADSDDLSSQFSADAEFREEPLSKFEKIRNRLAALKRRRRQRIAHSPDDPSASAMSEPWEEKQARIRQSSPYGDLEGWKLTPVIIKTGDDLRQELLAYQLLTTLQNIWRDENVPLYLRPYKILVCSADSGMIEPIPNACSLHQIKKNLSSKPSLDDAAQPYSPTLLSHFLINYGSRLSESFQQAQQNFVRSCAAYSLACYFLQVGFDLIWDI